MHAKIKEIHAEDCGVITYKSKKTKKPVDEAVMNSFLTRISPLPISLTDKNRQDKSPLAEYRQGFDHKFGWYAGRYIGEALFYHNDNPYKITIRPRFGYSVLNHMISEITNIRLADARQIQQNNDEAFLKNILAMLWLKKINDANKYGLPRQSMKRKHQGHMIKGKLDIRESLMPLRIKKQAVSYTTEKVINPTIANILLQTHQILKDYIHRNQQTEAVKNAINYIHQFGQMDRITNNDYKHIRYNAIDSSWKEVVDFSWVILQKKKQSQDINENGKKGYHFFFDMAEIWECYIKAILKKSFPDWRIWTQKESEIPVYQDNFYKRDIIPDIIMEKEGEIIVFDAKYKAMNNEGWDVDREDFFQIHSYMQAFNKVKAGGLIYPLVDRLDKNQSDSLFGLGHHDMRFIIDGIVIENKALNDSESESESESKKIQNLREFEQNFARRMADVITTNTNTQLT